MKIIYQLSGDFLRSPDFIQFNFYGVNGVINTFSNLKSADILLSCISVVNLARAWSSMV